MNKLIRYTIIFCVCIIIQACSGTRCLQDGESLYVGSTLLIKQKKLEPKTNTKYFGMKATAAYLTVWDLPNGALFGMPAVRFIPFRLILFNWFYNKKEKGFSHWMRNNLGEDPILLTDIDPELKRQKLIQTYENFGHFGTTAGYTVHYKRKNKKAFVHYQVELAQAYTYRKVEFNIDSSQKQLLNSINTRIKKSILKPNLEYNLDSIKQERRLVFNQLQNDGFCFIQESDILIEADTSIGNKQVDLRISINPDLSPKEATKAKIDGLRISLDSSVQSNMNIPFYFYSFGKLKRKFLDSIIYLKAGNTYSLKKSTITNSRLSSLGMFKSNYISYTPKNGDSTQLLATIMLSPADATNFSFNVKGSYKTAGYIGPSVGFKLTQLNLFGKAQNLFVEVDAYYDFPIGVFRDRISNSSGISARSILKAPFTNPKIKLAKKSNELPFQFVSFNIEYNDRKDFFKMISLNTSYGLSWSHKKNHHHRLDLVNITFSDLLETTQRFDDLVAENPSLKASLINQFIFGMAYTYTYDDRTKEKNPSGLYFQLHGESSGNLLYLTNTIFKNEEDGSKEFLNIKFAQFALASYDLRYYLKTGRSSALVFRHLGGFGLPYGNSSLMPYIRQFFIGGTNSIRPIGARTVGPGRYLEFNKGEVNQVGDIKLEVNLEFRFRISIRVNGAFWSDAGNIWLFKEDPERPGSGIRWGKVAQDSYFTSGTGLRIDLNYLILRLDYGVILYAPVFSDGYKWIWQNNQPLWHGVIGFGYPF